MEKAPRGSRDVARCGVGALGRHFTSRRLTFLVGAAVAGPALVLSKPGTPGRPDRAGSSSPRGVTGLPPGQTTRHTALFQPRVTAQGGLAARWQHSPKRPHAHTFATLNPAEIEEPNTRIPGPPSIFSLRGLCSVSLKEQLTKGPEAGTAQRGSSREIAAGSGRPRRRSGFPHRKASGRPSCCSCLLLSPAQSSPRRASPPPARSPGLPACPAARPSLRSPRDARPLAPSLPPRCS